MPAVVAMTDPVSIGHRPGALGGVLPALREHGRTGPGARRGVRRPGRARRRDRPRALRPARRAPAVQQRPRPRADRRRDRRGPRPVDRPCSPSGRRSCCRRSQRAGGDRAPDCWRAATRRRPRSRRRERGAEGAQAAIDALCQEAIEVPFAAPGAGGEPPAYDARCPSAGCDPFDADDQGVLLRARRLVGELRAEAGRPPLPGGAGAVRERQVVAGAGRARRRRCRRRSSGCRSLC